MHAATSRFARHRRNRPPAGLDDQTPDEVYSSVASRREPLHSCQEIARVAFLSVP